jgi:formylglycine-generating enzyme required for sulfatase activity
MDWRFLAAIGGALVALLAIYLLTRPSQPTEPANKEKQVVTFPPEPELPRSLSIPTGDMVLVGEGESIMGPKGAEKTLKIAPFYIDRTEVTNGQYRRFCTATNRNLPPLPEWDRKYFDKDDYPVINVTWQDAADFAAWAGKRLPTEQEWEKAARGFDGRTYPWGNWTQATAANLVGTDDGHKYTSPVAAFPYDESPAGAIDLAGNVSEWVAGDFGNGQKVVRGGNYLSEVEQVPASHRQGGPITIDPKKTSPIGFRCAANPKVALKLAGVNAPPSKPVTQSQSSAAPPR